MPLRPLITLGFLFLFHATLTNANPILMIPGGTFQERMTVDIKPTTGGLVANYHGNFDCRFPSSNHGSPKAAFKPEEYRKICFPVPAGSNNVVVGTSEAPIPWHWSEQHYSTELAEMPKIPMAEWSWPTSQSWDTTHSFSFDYSHPLLKQDQSYLYFYALGVWSLMDREDSPSSLHYFDDRQVAITINLPDDYLASQIRAGDESIGVTSLAGALLGNRLSLHFDSRSFRFNHNLIVQLIPNPAGFRVAGLAPSAAYRDEIKYDGKSPLLLHVTFNRPVRKDRITSENFSIVCSKYYYISPNDSDARQITPDSIDLVAPTVVRIMLKPKTVNKVRFIKLKLKSGETGLCDLEGNMLDGEQLYDFPSGDGQPGGDFTAAFSIRHHD